MFPRILIAALLVWPVFGQLTKQEKAADLNQLAGLYAKYYAPFGWKWNLFGFDLYNLQPWLDQANQTTDDIGFYDLSVRYVASLKDAHDELLLPSDFYAYMGFRVDIYDGAVVIESINRTMLPLRQFNFVVGDEVVSVDGTSAADLITQFAPYAVNGNGSDSGRKRIAADMISLRFQQFMPTAPKVPNSSTVVIKHQNGGSDTYTIPWILTGTAITGAGLVPQPMHAPLRVEDATRPVRSRGPGNRIGTNSNPWGVWEGPAMPKEFVPAEEYLEPFKQLDNMAAVEAPSYFAGFGSPTPIFNPPPGFKLRLGALASDQFLSGTFPVGNSNIGFIRIATMQPANSTTAVQQFAAEVAYFNQNTDALVIDLMRNGGGSGCYTEALAQYLMQRPFRGLAQEIRATNAWVTSFSQSLTLAKLLNAPQWVIDIDTLYVNVMQQTLASNRGNTGALPACDQQINGVSPAKDSKGNLVSYSKPILVLTDDFTLSAGEILPMMLQDEGRATIFGTRTGGAGGSVAQFYAQDYSETSARVTQTLITRAKDVQTPGYPASHYIENVGVYPDMPGDYMTKENLLNGGQPFVAAFSAAVAGLVGK